MKKLLILFLFLIGSYVNAQATEKVEAGFVLTTANQQIEFVNLRFHDDSVTFLNTETSSDFTYMLNSIKKVVDKSGNVIFENKAWMTRKQIESHPDHGGAVKIENSIAQDSILQFGSINKIWIGNRVLTPREVRMKLSDYPRLLDDYNSGRSSSTIGGVMLGAGIGLIIGGGISNLNAADSSSESGSQTKKGSPIPIIVGLAAGVISIPILVSGKNKVRRSIEGYNQQKGFASRWEVKFNAGIADAGLVIQF